MAETRGIGAEGRSERRCTRCDPLLATWRGSRLDVADDVGRDRLEVLRGSLPIVCPDRGTRVLIAAGTRRPGDRASVAQRVRAPKAVLCVSWPI